MWLSVRQQAILALGVSLLAAAVCLYTPPGSDAPLATRPDSVEYAAAGYRLAFQGTLQLPMGSGPEPSRYGPWFSLLVAAPLYRLLGPEPGAPIVGVLLFGLLGVAAAFGIGRRLAGNAAGGVLAAGLLLLCPLYRCWAAAIMTDVPATSLVLLAGLLFLRNRDNEPSPARWLAAGLTVALAAAFRPLCASLLIPFVWQAAARSRRSSPQTGWRPPPAGAALVLLPYAGLAAATLIYNRDRFGSPWRNGYQFWCGVPYDYFHLVFSPAYAQANATSLLASGLPFLAVVTALLLHLQRRRATPGGTQLLRAFLLFGAAGLAPLLGAHLLYFFSDPRFFLPPVALLSVAAGGCLGRLLPTRLHSAALPMAFLMLGGALLARSLAPTPSSLERRAVAQMRPPGVNTNTILITAMDPLYVGLGLEFEPGVAVLPLSRRVEYASKLLTEQRVPEPDPSPTGWWDHRCAGLLKGGAREAYPLVAEEALDWLERELRGGRPVYLASTFAGADDANALRDVAARFRRTAVSPSLYRLHPRDP